MMIISERQICNNMDNDGAGVTPLRIPLTRWQCASDVCPATRPSETLGICLKESRQIRFAELGENWIYLDCHMTHSLVVNVI